MILKPSHIDGVSIGFIDNSEVAYFYRATLYKADRTIFPMALA